MYGLVTARRLNRWTALFLASTAATSITGFLFPIEHVTPGIIVGTLSIIVLGVAVVARYNSHLKGAARVLYVISASVALYFNVFVLVVQSFEKAPALRALAPTQKEPPFAITQLLVLAVCGVNRHGLKMLPPRLGARRRLGWSFEAWQRGASRLDRVRAGTATRWFPSGSGGASTTRS